MKLHNQYTSLIVFSHHSYGNFLLQPVTKSDWSYKDYYSLRVNGSDSKFGHLNRMEYNIKFAHIRRATFAEPYP